MAVSHVCPSVSLARAHTLFPPLSFSILFFSHSLLPTLSPFFSSLFFPLSLSLCAAAVPCSAGQPFASLALAARQNGCIVASVCGDRGVGSLHLGSARPAEGHLRGSRNTHIHTCCVLAYTHTHTNTPLHIHSCKQWVMRGEEWTGQKWGKLRSFLTDATAAQTDESLRSRSVCVCLCVCVLLVQPLL